ncbi:DDE-type integrase/transposase/recombinase [Helicobacter burdigaliensis]|uniref:DDE-type integrase/transposase/recombinase n=1 Tax=Helicobacter burdigaliensis TaxID=2315334 RepID=UPI000EF6ED2B|nr:DDE-type integrase/transposase/recombinase [Helicobacter burdigaliensis]
MYYLDTKSASIIFNVSEGALRLCATRNSKKYEWIKIDNEKGGRGGKKLLFKVSKEQILTAFNQGLIDDNITIIDQNSQNVKLEEINKDNNSILNEDLDLTEKKEEKSPSLSLLNLNFENLPIKAKEKAREKLKALKQIEKYIEGGITLKRALILCGVEWRNYSNWRADYNQHGILGLIDTRGMYRKDSTKLKSWMQEFALSAYRTFGAGDFNYTELWWRIHKEASKKENYDFIGFDLGEVKPLFSVKTLQNFITNYFKDKPLEHCIITKGLDKAKSYFLPSQGNQREIFASKNECWQIDSSPADFIVRDDITKEPFRPHILSIVDVYSGRGVASLAPKSNSLSLMRLLWNAISTLGKPKMIKGDNGRDYLSKNFQDLLDGLGITYDASIAYAGEEKALVERRFGTLQHAGLSQMHGAIGKNLSERELIEQRTPKKERSAKDKYGFAKKTNQEHLHLFSEAQKLLESEVYKWNSSKVRRKKGVKTPSELWNECPNPIIKIEYEEFLFHAGAKELRIVGKKGINFNGSIYKSEFMPSVKTKVKCVQNIDNAKELFVYDLQGNFICLALDESIAELSAESLKNLKKAFKEDMNSISKMLKKEELSTFTKLNIKEDLELAKIAFNKSLKEENTQELTQKSLAKEKLDKQKEIESIKNAPIDLESLAIYKEESEEKEEEFSMEDFINRKFVG